MRTNITRVLAAAGLTAAALLAGTGPAHAAERDGNCDAGEFCYYFNSGNQGSVSDFNSTHSASDYGASLPSCYVFRGAGNGKDQCIKNSAASVWNRTSRDVAVYFNSGYSGASDRIARGYKGNLSSTLHNQNASHRPEPGTETGAGTGTGTARKAMSFSIYDRTGGRITAGFDGYSRPELGRHEGIDIARGTGSPVRALVSGQVTNVVEGRRGSGSARLSTIAVYNPSYDKTVIYLHSDPSSSLSVGENISKDQQIGVEDYRGASGAHTHVEMRPGRKLRASVSGDSVLVNPDPTSFWNGAGYNER